MTEAKSEAEAILVRIIGGYKHITQTENWEDVDAFAEWAVSIAKNYCVRHHISFEDVEETE